MRVPIGILFLIAYTNAGRLPSGYEYLAQYDAAYRVYAGFDESRSFDDASLRCAFDGGAVLFHPTSKQEAEDVLGTIPTNRADESFSMWIGIHELREDGTPVTVDGNNDFYQSLLFNHTMSGTVYKPILFKNLTYKFERADRFLSDERNFACKKSYVCDDEKDKNVRLASDGYTVIEEFQAGYKGFNVTSSHMHQAYYLCSTQGATVFTPESSRELEAVFEKIVPKEVDRIKLGIIKFEEVLGSVEGRRDFPDDWFTSYERRKSEVARVTIGRNETSVTTEFSSFWSDNDFVVCKRTVKRECSTLKSNAGPVYVKELNKILEFLKTKRNFYYANNHCDYLKGNLVNLRDETELDIVLHAFGLQKSEPKMKIWHLPNKEDEDENSAKRCHSLSSSGKLSTEMCDHERPYICEITNPSKSMPWNADAIMHPSPTILSYRDANEYCKSLNMTLANVSQKLMIIGFLNWGPVKNLVQKYRYDQDLRQSEEVFVDSVPLTSGRVKPYCLGLRSDGATRPLDCESKHFCVCVKAEFMK